MQTHQKHTMIMMAEQLMASMLGCYDKARSEYQKLSTQGAALRYIGILVQDPSAGLIQMLGLAEACWATRRSVW